MPVAIAGMHRSGTSMVTRLLNLCGLYLGAEGDLLSTARDNPEGFWENLEFQKVNDEVLALFGGAWDVPPLLEKGWETSPYLTNIYRNASIAIGKISRQSTRWGWKDPRNSLTLPLWKRLLPDLKIIVCIRNPVDVYRSLALRGYSSNVFSNNLWMTYNHQLMESTVPQERMITHYDCFFRNPHAELRRLVDFLEIEVSDETIDVACQTISTDLRHYKGSMDDFYATNPSTELLDLYKDMCFRAGDVYGSHLLADESAFLQNIAPTEEFLVTPFKRELQKLNQYLAIANEENARIQLEIVALQKAKATEIEQLQKAKEIEIIALQKAHQIEAAALQKAKEIEIAELRNEKTAEITTLQKHITILQSTTDEIFASRSWRLIQTLRQIRVFFVPVGSTRAKILRGIFNLLSLKYMRMIFSLLREQGISQFFRTSSNIVPTKIYADLIVTAHGNQRDEYVPITDKGFSANESLVKLIAFYLPQFHPIPENDEWWGKGFVEWTNVSKAVPQFLEHYQPHLPGELGFYDLRLPDILKRQVELARKYGIHGFAFHYYWFDGKRLLEKPLDLFLNSKEDFPFCICWANENWTRRWDGQENDVLIAQNHSAESDLRFIHDVSSILKDERYIRINGRPVLIVYRANIIPDIKNTVKMWREYCIDNGIGNPYLVAAQTFWFEDPREVDFDAAVEFPPHNVEMTNIRASLQIANPNYQGSIYDYAEIIERKTAVAKADYTVFKTIFPSWDNEARKPGKGTSYIFSSPARYKEWLVRTAKITLQDPDPEKRLVFINAWNEWGEGAHLEPDRKYGYAYLQATADALKEISDNKTEN